MGCEPWAHACPTTLEIGGRPGTPANRARHPSARCAAVVPFCGHPKLKSAPCSRGASNTGREQRTTASLGPEFDLWSRTAPLAQPLPPSPSPPCPAPLEAAEADVAASSVGGLLSMMADGKKAVPLGICWLRGGSGGSACQPRCQHGSQQRHHLLWRGPQFKSRLLTS
jgi:hypothetical protein